MLCNGFTINKWQIDMERSLRFNTLFFYRTPTLLFLLFLFPVLAQATESVYEQQIQQARNGNYTPFLDYLQRYQQQHALTPEHVADWLQVAAWAGHDDEVIQVWQRYGIYMPLPARGVAAVAQSRRNQKAWQPALALWKEARSLAPDNDDYRIGYIKTLADARMDTLALQEAQRLVAENPSQAHLQTLSYVWLRQGKSWDRLLADTRALNIAPENKALLSELIDALTDSRVNTPALQLSQSMTLSPAERRRLERNAAAERVRLADVPGRTEKERLQLAQSALNRYDALLARWQNEPQAAEDVVLARIDRLGALYAHADYPQVISEYQDLTAARHPVPGWAIGWVISAYLQEKNAAAAFALLQRYPQYASDPQDEEHALFYTWLDTGEYQSARQYVEGQTRGVPWTRYDFGSPTPQPNDRWLTGQSLRFNYLLATNALPEAETLAHRLATTAPGNQGLQIDYATLLQARGLPRAAEQKLKTAEALEPSNTELEQQQAYVAMDLQEWRQMDLLADDVLARAPADRSARRLDRLRTVHHMSELRLNATRYAQSNFEEGKGTSRHLLGGVEWRPRDLQLEAELSSNRYHGANKPGARLSTTYFVTDNWQVSGSLERLSRTTPLRALRNGISANRGEGGVRWYQNERREYQFSAALSRFSDHNRRQEYTLTGKERLWQTPSLTLDLEPGIAASKNSLRDTLYFNPARDLSVTAALAVDHEMYRHYDTLWSQQFVAGGGSYWQKNQSAGAIALLGYGQRVQWNNVIDTGVMLNWDKRPYDGKRESNLSVTFDATLRF
ncbi:MAG: hmsH [Enterobacter mori]|nr:hmsH [Enterobacter mori]